LTNVAHSGFDKMLHFGRLKAWMSASGGTSRSSATMSCLQSLQVPAMRRTCPPVELTKRKAPEGKTPSGLGEISGYSQIRRGDVRLTRMQH